LIIRVPGLPPRRSQTPAGHVDIMPTLANLAGGAPNADMMGRSLVDVLAGAADFARVVLQQLSYEGNHEMRAGVDAHCHVIYNVSPETSWEVYQLDHDPAETRDVAGDDDACSSTRAAVARWYDREQVPAGATEALLPPGTQVAAPLDVKLGDKAALLSVEAPAQAKPGDTVTLTWTWKATGSLGSDWRVFVHAKGSGGAFINGDHEPVRPFGWWKPGQLIRYSTTIALPRHAAAGRYTVSAGVFRGQSRLPATGGHAKIVDNAIDVATIEVAP
jgi:hypothetical protein